MTLALLGHSSSAPLQTRIRDLLGGIGVWDLVAPAADRLRWSYLAKLEVGIARRWPKASATKPTGPTVLIGSIRSVPRSVFVYELCLAAALALRGYRSYVWIDDCTLLHHDTLQFRGYEQSSLLRTRVRLETDYGLKMARAARVNYVLTSELTRTARSPVLDRKDLADLWNLIASWRGIDGAACKNYPQSWLEVLEDVRASVIRYFRTPCLERIDPERFGITYLRWSLQSALASRQAALELLKRLQPRYYITTHGIYSTWGPAYRVMAAAGVRVVVHDVGWRAERIRIRRGGIMQEPASSDPRWIQWRDRSLSQEEKVHADALLTKRMARTEIDVPALGRTPVSDQLVWLRRARASGKRLVGIFLNVPWDASLVGSDFLFSGLEEWLRVTVQWVRNAQDRHAVIRLHPADQEGTARSLMWDAVGGQPDPNITVFDEKSQVDSYMLVRDLLDCVVVYNGTLGLESILLGVPSVMVGKAPFWGQNICWEPRDVREYFHLLQHLRREDVTEERRDLARKFLLYYMEDMERLFPVWDDRNYRERRISAKKCGEILWSTVRGENKAKSLLDNLLDGYGLL